MAGRILSMSASGTKKYTGNHDFQLGEHRNVRVHIYDTVINANADAANANQRFCFIAETNRFYMGRSNVWLLLDSLGEVAAPSNLPTDETLGAAYRVDADPTIGGQPNLYILGSGNIWYPLRNNGAATSIVAATTTVTLTSSSRLYVKINSAGGTFNITVPATAVEGDTIILKDLGGQLNTNPVYLVPGSQTIDGLSGNLEMNRRYQCIIMKYLEGHWIVLSDA